MKKLFSLTEVKRFYQSTESKDVHKTIHDPTMRKIKANRHSRRENHIAKKTIEDMITDITSLWIISMMSND